MHYPTISTDMLAMVYSRRPSYNHDAAIASSKLASLVKVSYTYKHTNTRGCWLPMATIA